MRRLSADIELSGTEVKSMSASAPCQMDRHLRADPRRGVLGSSDLHIHPYSHGGVWNR